MRPRFHFRPTPDLRRRFGAFFLVPDGAEVATVFAPAFCFRPLLGTKPCPFQLSQAKAMVRVTGWMPLPPQVGHGTPFSIAVTMPLPLHAEQVSLLEE